MTTPFLAKRRFSDDKHFRRGFSRSGAFTIKEAELLERCGHAFKELEEGSREAIDPIEQAFLAVCKGEAEPSSAEEKVWAKYKKLTGRRSFHGLVGTPRGGSAASGSGSDDSSSDDSSSDIDEVDDAGMDDSED